MSALEGAVISSSPQTMVCTSICPAPQQHHKPWELQLQSTKQSGSGQLGRASAPGRTYYSSP